MVFRTGTFDHWGVDASPKAHRAIMDRSPESFNEDSSHGFTIYRSDKLELWEGDFIKLPADNISPPGIIYDKAAVIALPPAMRSSYANKLIELCSHSTQIIMQTFEYPQNEMNGPPFSVSRNELEQRFGDHLLFDLLHEQPKLDELTRFRKRGLSPYLSEKIHLLKPLQGNKVH